MLASWEFAHTEDEDSANENIQIDMAAYQKGQKQEWRYTEQSGSSSYGGGQDMRIGIQMVRTYEDEDNKSPSKEV